ncbi:MAG: 4-hydroxy-tetrahydrodipicolinate reductase [Bacteroidales bacterium]|jgi:4-hydroxy-tetrahydrodipicolinate reductase|nr:4-hydroxy-tetrahydrodipicolinate reductase [Bacteroidales bacterium]
MNIALLGYGKMGKTIEKIALQNGHVIVAKIDNDSDWEQFVGARSARPPIDIAIEFSTPQTVVKNIFRCFDLNIPIVVGTTGWNEQKDEIFSYCKQHQKALFYASNFSIGVNLFFELNKHLAQMMKNYSDYNVHIEETHHLQKLDKPSGTAITLAENLIENYPQKKSWTCDAPNETLETLNIKALRKEDVFGIHSIFYESNEDIIEIKHEAKSRDGFAKGALLSAEWLVGKQGVFTMKDMLGIKR